MRKQPEVSLSLRLDLCLLVQAWCLGFWVRTLLWLLPMPAFNRWLEQACQMDPNAGINGPALSVTRLAQAVRVTARFVPASSCLTRAYTGRILLARYRIPAFVHVGVRKVSGTMESHAWLEASGQVCMGDYELSSYTQLF